eukprot:TRINITY_DN1889_c6_g1_i1.p1 TRINITY_DN1889_c6_g1~~TRINITY_DN1889_c6_g1_i1.p1  ORF type:complete len:170 (+),score=21.07 TRINITY_DN1889_c6_g1_i1:56-511(+)
MGKCPKSDVIYPGVCVKAVEEMAVRSALGEGHWNKELYPMFCNGYQSGVVKRMVGKGLVMVRFTHKDETSTSLTFPTAALYRCEELTTKPSPFSNEPQFTDTCVVCDETGNPGHFRKRGFKCQGCVGIRTRFRLFKNTSFGKSKPRENQSQ